MPHKQSPISTWQGKRTLVIGDVMLDRYLHGRTERISPEAPIPILDLERQYDRLGGAANVALNIKALGGRPTLLGLIGHDADGRILENLSRQHIGGSQLLAASDRPTTVKTRLWAGQHQILRMDKESTRAASMEIERVLLDRIRLLLPDSDVVVLQDYNKGVLTEKIIRTTLRLANERDIPSVVDPKRNHFWTYEGASLFKPNLKEIREQTDFPITPGCRADLERAAAFIQSRLRNAISMITLSEHGIFLSDGNKTVLAPTTPRNIVDVCGAGDTVLSVAALGMAIGLELKELGRLANMAGGQVCGQAGVAPVDLEELTAEYLAED